MDVPLANKPAAARRHAAAVTIGSVYELEYGTVLILDWLLQNFRDAFVEKLFFGAVTNPIAALQRIWKTGAKLSDLRSE